MKRQCCGISMNYFACHATLNADCDASLSLVVGFMSGIEQILITTLISFQPPPDDACKINKQLLNKNFLHLTANFLI